jgi:hypothetical protein
VRAGNLCRPGEVPPPEGMAVERDQLSLPIS